ncbi:MAG: Alpha-galactosidase [Ferruginibacter sp.]|nr:Alpha-galactosidase [Ferruginibacter sp.]
MTRMHRISKMLFLFIFFTVKIVNCQQSSPVWLDDLNIRTFSEGIPAVLSKTSGSGDTMRMNGITFFRGIGVNSTSVLTFLLNGNGQEFTAIAGVDDNGVKELAHNFYVIGDRKIIFESGPMKWGDIPKKVKVNLKGINRLGLLVVVDMGVNKTYSNWADAQFMMNAGQVPMNIPNTDVRYILTPAVAKTPRINSPRIFGATPGNPFLYTVSATGERPIRFSANLPNGLSIDPATGIITGKLTRKGVYMATLKAANATGESTAQLTIKIGDTIALTPPIGWNGWNSWAREIDREKVIASADAMVKIGLANHGWTYINIDDAWQGQRGGKYNAIQPNSKFPEFKQMVDYVHGLGLKLGVYSTPWITSYAGYPGGSSNFENGIFPDSVRDNKRAYRYIGKYRFEKNDALQMADWGVDYLKYDWRIDLSSAERMSVALKQSGRDILYSLSNSAPFSNVKDWARISNAYRTGPDIRDSWLSLYTSAFTLDKWSAYGGPGHWNDPDMMILGNVTTGTQLHATRLTPDEQYSHVSLFSLLAAPLLIGCPIEQLDAFTLNLLTNDEVIAVDQDPLGKPGRLISDEEGIQTWVKPLEDGSYAVGLFNVDNYGKTPPSYFRWGDEKESTFQLDFAKLGLKGKWQLRDLWRQKDLGESNGSFKTSIPHHGVVMIRMIPKGI